MVEQTHAYLEASTSKARKESEMDSQLRSLLSTAAALAERVQQMDTALLDKPGMTYFLELSRWRQELLFIT